MSNVSESSGTGVASGAIDASRTIVVDEEANSTVEWPAIDFNDELDQDDDDETGYYDETCEVDEDIDLSGSNNDEYYTDDDDYSFYDDTEDEAEENMTEESKKV